MFRSSGETRMTFLHPAEEITESQEFTLILLNTQYELKLCAVSNLGINWTMFLKKWGKYYQFLVWFTFATKIFKISWQGHSVKLLVKFLRCCYCVLATVYEISFIFCRTIHTNSIVNCQTPTIPAKFFTFNCNFSHNFEIIFKLFCY